MSQKRNYKICLIGECLATGGAEKAMALLSDFFVSKGIDVHTVIVVDSVTYHYSGKLLNLGKMKNRSNGLFNKLGRFRALKKFLNENTFDYIIDFRIRVSFLQEFAISRFLYNVPVVYTVHSAMTNLYVPASNALANAIYGNAFGVTAVSYAIAQKLVGDYGLKNTKTIHNPVDLDVIANLSDKFISLDGKYILAAGRMTENKQFAQLIEAYAKSQLPKKQIKLVILGDGEQRKYIEKTIATLDLQQSVILKGALENPYPYMKNAMFFVLSSKREGLPTVILESLACGTPVISFDCVSGPSEMIVHKQNGLLVDDQDFEKMTNALNIFVTDTALYDYCKANAKTGITNFSLENIGRQWLEFLKIDVV
jgi:glycosyltransferase involved in cell wall biosynthesis